MSATDKIISLGKLIEEKLVIKAQNVRPSAQSGDIEQIFKDAKVWDLSDAVAPLLNMAGIPESVSLQISIKVDATYNVSYAVQTTPPHNSANMLARLLKAKFGNQMKAALTASKPNITDTVELNWLKF